MNSHLKCIHEIARKYRICPGVDINKEIIPSKAMVKFKTEFEKWKSGMKKARSECRESFLRTFSEITKIRGYTDGEPQFKVGGGQIQRFSNQPMMVDGHVVPLQL